VLETGNPALAGFEFHHLGIATKNLEESVRFWASLGYVATGDSFVDQAQGIKGVFLEGDGPRLELLENLPGSETLTPFLRRRLFFYHMGYFVHSLRQAIDWAQQDGAVMLRSPTKSVAFKSEICFVMMKNGTILEFIERRA